MQHVGQVFFQEGMPQLTDIDCCMRGVLAPVLCRKEPEWVYG
jgi:hypothetical protein